MLGLRPVETHTGMSQPWGGGEEKVRLARLWEVIHKCRRLVHGFWNNWEPVWVDREKQKWRSRKPGLHGTNSSVSSRLCGHQWDPKAAAKPLQGRPVGLLLLQSRWEGGVVTRNALGPDSTTARRALLWLGLTMRLPRYWQSTMEWHEEGGQGPGRIRHKKPHRTRGLQTGWTASFSRCGRYTDKVIFAHFWNYIHFTWPESSQSSQVNI